VFGIPPDELVVPDVVFYGCLSNSYCLENRQREVKVFRPTQLLTAVALLYLSVCDYLRERQSPFPLPSSGVVSMIAGNLYQPLFLKKWLVWLNLGEVTPVKGAGRRSQSLRVKRPNRTTTHFLPD